LNEAPRQQSRQIGFAKAKGQLSQIILAIERQDIASSIQHGALFNGSGQKKRPQPEKLGGRTLGPSWF
jgi:hypothetical protein